MKILIVFNESRNVEGVALINGDEQLVKISS